MLVYGYCTFPCVCILSVALHAKTTVEGTVMIQLLSALSTGMYAQYVRLTVLFSI